ncbi:MAG: ribosomal RNA small subunit methyltransferase A [Myxococcales bacterium FL481]|nr:MAG: ribosomal RNA small subunit methyltransferase A [Myxococcales bacterium FL481]
MSNPPPRSPAQLLRQYGLTAKKSWGQNFLHDASVHGAIAAEVLPDRDVVEIGPGLGSLTVHLLARARQVVAIERDREMCAVLRQEYATANGLTIREADAVKFDYAQTGCRQPTVVGNLPYQLTGPLLFRLLDYHTHLGPWILMVQREVGDRLAADPGTRSYGAATVSLSRLRAITKVRNVPRGAFTPPPRVDSAILRFDPLERPRGEVDNAAAFPRFVQTLFQRRRKTLLNALSAVMDRADAARACASLGIDPGIRPERLTTEQFAALDRHRTALVARADD